MEKTLYFDYCAFLILIVMTLSFVVRKKIVGKVNFFFLYLLGVSIAATFFDTVAVLFDRMGEGHRIAKYVLHNLYLICRSLQPAIYATYIVSLTDSWHKIEKNRILGAVVNVPILVVFLTVIFTPWTGFIYYLDGSDAYTRGSGFWLLYLSAAIYSLYAFCHIIEYRKIIGRQNTVPLMAVFPLLLSSVIIQLLKPSVLIEMFFNALGLLFIMLIVHRPDRRIDDTIGLNKYSAYVEDMKRAFLNEKPMRVILADIENYHVLEEVIGYDSMQAAMHQLAMGFLYMNKRLKLKAELYYIGFGSFRVVLDRKHFYAVKEVADTIAKASGENLIFGDMGISTHTDVCVVSCPEDISDFDALLTFENDSSRKKHTGQTVYARDIIKNGKYSIIKKMDYILENALVNKKFEVYYQPIFDVRNNKYNSAEALLRLYDETYGFISPEIFIPAAEKNGAIHQIGRFVMETVCQFICSDEFKKLGLDYIEVNLSVAQCMRQGLADEIIELMKKYGVKPWQINLEITETAVGYTQRIMEENIDKLTKADIEFSLDDFGTGYSNMMRIASLPLKIVKIDKSFTRIADNPKLEIVLKNSIRMIKDMNMKIVIEGVETEEMACYFGEELECEYIQGYYFSKPVSRVDFVEIVRLRNMPA